MSFADKAPNMLGSYLKVGISLLKSGRFLHTSKRPQGLKLNAAAGFMKQFRV